MRNGIVEPEHGCIPQAETAALIATMFANTPAPMYRWENCVRV